MAFGDFGRLLEQSEGRAPVCLVEPLEGLRDEQVPTLDAILATFLDQPLGPGEPATSLGRLPLLNSTMPSQNAHRAARVSSPRLMYSLCARAAIASLSASRPISPAALPSVSPFAAVSCSNASVQACRAYASRPSSSAPTVVTVPYYRKEQPSPK